MEVGLVTLVVLCHPQERSFNHAVCEAVTRTLKARGHTVLFHDLYRERFDPLLTAVELKRRFSFDEPVQRSSRELAEADALIFIHPEWWSGPPALLKGWIDRVFRPGVAYDYAGEDFLRKSKVPLLAGKRSLILATTDAEATPGEPPLARMWKEILGFCGVEEVTFRLLTDMRALDVAERRGWLSQIEGLVAELFPAEG